MEHGKHDSLHWIATALKVVAWIVLILGLVGGVGAMIAGQQAGEEAARRGMEAAGMGAVGTGVTGGILAIIMAVVWFLILYALSEISSTVLDVWNRGTAYAGETAVSTRRDVAPATSADYSTTRPVPPPAGAPS